MKTKTTSKKNSKKIQEWTRQKQNCHDNANRTIFKFFPKQTHTQTHTQKEPLLVLCHFDIFFLFHFSGPFRFFHLSRGRNQHGIVPTPSERVLRNDDCFREKERTHTETGAASLLFFGLVSRNLTETCSKQINYLVRILGWAFRQTKWLRKKEKRSGTKRETEP